MVRQIYVIIILIIIIIIIIINNRHFKDAQLTELSQRRPWRRRNQAYVFSECLKQSSEINGSRSLDDKVFQAAGPDVENARGPNVDVSVLGTTSWLSSADRSRDRPKTLLL